MGVGAMCVCAHVECVGMVTGELWSGTPDFHSGLVSEQAVACKLTSV